MEYKNLTLIGTSHVAKQSIEEVKKGILEKNPEIIALELDIIRLSSMLNKRKRSIKFSDIKKIGFTGLFFNLIGAWIENKIGKVAGTKPGNEMLTAIKLAKKEKIKIALVDQDIRITLQKLSKKITFKEKLRLFTDLLFGSIFHKEKVRIDLSKVPEKEIIEKLTKEFKKRYPSLHEILVEDRNKVMAKNLNKLISENKDKKILAVVGAGHKEAIIRILKDGEKRALQ